MTSLMLAARADYVDAFQLLVMTEVDVTIGIPEGTKMMSVLAQEDPTALKNSNAASEARVGLTMKQAADETKHNDYHIVAIDSGVPRRPPAGKRAQDQEYYPRVIKLLLNNFEYSPNPLYEVSALKIQIAYRIWDLGPLPDTGIKGVYLLLPIDVVVTNKFVGLVEEDPGFVEDLSIQNFKAYKGKYGKHVDIYSCVWVNEQGVPAILHSLEVAASFGVVSTIKETPKSIFREYFICLLWDPGHHLSSSCFLCKVPTRPSIRNEGINMFFCSQNPQFCGGFEPSVLGT
ncbi:ankyrin-3-like [Iris pallida]|uniref:Ankyrin-3-like n=1 Tax=Iris pallida TaxID=29817 RepID=A0AAX6DVD0_IRIPA|nr:ankyrin-3-like [Iris pallida]